MTPADIERRFREKAATMGLTDPDVQSAFFIACSGFARMAGDLLVDLTSDEWKMRWKRYEGIVMLLGLARDMAEDVGAAQGGDGTSVFLAVALRHDILAKSAPLRAMYAVAAQVTEVVEVPTPPPPGFKE
jgi:hypothetical protein